MIDNTIQIIIKRWSFRIYDFWKYGFLRFSNIFEIFGFLKRYFWVFGVFCIIYIFFMRLSYSVWFSVYMKTFLSFKIFLNIFLKNVPGMWTIFVWTFCFCDFLRFEENFWGPKWSLHPSPSPASMSKFPSGGKVIENNCF